MLADRIQAITAALFIIGWYGGWPCAALLHARRCRRREIKPIWVRRRWSNDSGDGWIGVGFGYVVGGGVMLGLIIGVVSLTFFAITGQAP